MTRSPGRNATPEIIEVFQRSATDASNTRGSHRSCARVSVPNSAAISRSRQVVGHRSPGRDGKLHHERRAGALDALHADAAAVRLHDALGDGQAEAGAGRSLGGLALHAEELVEDVRQVLGRNADAGV